MTVIDHPARAVTDLNRRIAREFGEHPCWKADLLWGADPVLEFGERRTFLGKSGPIVIGEYRLLLEDCDWQIADGETVLEGRDGGATREMLEAVLLGKQLLRVDWKRGFDLVFSEGIVVHCVGSGEKGRLFELRFANGDYVDCLADGVIEIEKAVT